MVKGLVVDHRPVWGHDGTVTTTRCELSSPVIGWIERPARLICVHLIPPLRPSVHSVSRKQFKIWTGTTLGNEVIHGHRFTRMFTLPTHE
jgi:hypothetical protein